MPTFTLSAHALITLEEVKALLGITSTSFDDKLTGIINFQSARLDRWCRVGLVQRTYVEQYLGSAKDERTFYPELANPDREFFTGGQTREIALRHYPVVSVASIEDGDGNSVASTDYHIRKRQGILEHFGGWPIPYDANELLGEWTITYTAGFFANTAAVTEDVKAAVFALVARQHSVLVPGVASMATGTLSVSFGDLSETAETGGLPAEVARAMGQYRIGNV